MKNRFTSAMFCASLTALWLASAAASAAVVLDAPGHAAPVGAAVMARGGEPGAAWHVVDWRGRAVEGAAGVFDAEGNAALPALPAGYYRIIGEGGRFVETSLPNANDEASDSGRDAPTARPRGPNANEKASDSGRDAPTTRPASAILATLSVVPPPLSREATLRTRSGHLSGEAALNDGEGAESAFAVDTALAWISRPGAFLCPWNGGDTERTVADLVRLCGFRHVRDRLKWGASQPSPDAPPDFSRNLATAALFSGRGAAVSGMFHDAPPWTGPAPKLPGDLGALHHFCAEAAAAFGDGVEDWEFWNEPDIHFAPEPVWEYVAAMKAAYLGFKSARPDLPVLNGALCQMPGASRYFKAFFANDAAPYFDVFNYHTYLPPAKYPEAFGKLRGLLREHGAEGTPVWVTEFGTNLEGHSDRDGVIAGLKAHSPEQELVHAEFYPKAQIALLNEGVERAYFFVFAAFNERRGRKDWGVMRRDGTVKHVFSAMATAIRELGDARLLGALDAPAGLRAYLFERPDGSQTVAFWSESPLDTSTSNSPSVEPEPDFARELRIALPEGPRRGSDEQRDNLTPSPPSSQSLPANSEPSRASREKDYRLADMCGMVSKIVPEDDGSIVLAATRYPAYLSGLGGLKADVPPHARATALGAGGPLSREAALRPQSGHLGIVLRPVLDRDDFAVSGGKTLAVMKGDTGRARIEVWNFSDIVRTGRVEAAGVSVAGLPAEPFAIAPGACAVFECVVAPEGGGRFVETSLPDATGGDTPTARPPRHDSDFALRAVFDGCPDARAVVPVFFEKQFLATCERVPVKTGETSLWERNSSADEQDIAFDEAEGAIRFTAVWHDDRTDRWLYPVRRLDLPRESPVGARRIAFEVKSDQDKAENDFRACKLMLAGDDGKTDIYLDYDPPTREWETRYVEIPPDADLSAVTLLRIGANPQGSRLTLQVRNVLFLKPTNRTTP